MRVAWVKCLSGRMATQRRSRTQLRLIRSSVRFQVNSRTFATPRSRAAGASSMLATSGRKQGNPELSPCIWFPPTLFFALTFVTHRSQLIINTAIVYMHRFYMIHSFTKFHRNVSIAAPNIQTPCLPMAAAERVSSSSSPPLVFPLRSFPRRRCSWLRRSRSSLESWSMS